MQFERKILLVGGFLTLLLLPLLVSKSMPEDALNTGIFRHYGSVKNTHPALSKLPSKILWAWQRPEDLRNLPNHIGVAYVATSIVLEGQTISITPRRHAMLVAPTSPRVPVVHIDASTAAPPALNASQRDAIVAALLNAVEFSNTKVVQLDFEVRRSQRQFLTDVVTAARKQLPADVALSMTALASWCAGDYWLSHMPADEVVPMAFRMAAGDAEIRALLAKHGRFERSPCRSAIGTATDEPLLNLPLNTPLNASVATRKNFRHYLFSPKPWTPAQWP